MPVIEMVPEPLTTSPLITVKGPVKLAGSPTLLMAGMQGYNPAHVAPAAFGFI
jgi:hypothetical protein